MLHPNVGDVGGVASDESHTRESVRLSHLKQCCSFPFVCNPLLLVITQSKIFVLHFVAFGREGIWYMFPSSPFVLCESESYWVYVGFGFDC